MGNIYLQQNKIEDSILNFEKCLELDNSSYYLRVLADVQVLKPEIDIAIKNYYKALEMDTEEYMIYNEIGFAQIAKKDFKAANEMFAKAIEKGDDNVKSYSYKGIGDIFRKEKSYDKSIENYKKAIELDKTNFDASIDMANSYSKKNNFQEAIIILKSVLEKDVKNGKAYFFLGKYYRDSGRNDESKESLKKSCELSYQKACDEINGIKKKKK